jgi:hypothetical protein
VDAGGFNAYPINNDVEKTVRLTPGGRTASPLKPARGARVASQRCPILRSIASNLDQFFENGNRNSGIVVDGVCVKSTITTPLLYYIPDFVFFFFFFFGTYLFLFNIFIIIYLAVLCGPLLFLGLKAAGFFVTCLGVCVMRVSLKVGSVIRVPVLAGWTATSSDPTVATAAVAGGFVTVTAKKAATCTLVLGINGDLSISLQIDVTA